MDQTTRRALAAALTDVNERYARVLVDPLADVEQYPAAFLSRYQIYRVDYVNPPREVAFYVGHAPDGPAFLLTGRPEEFARLAQADELTLDTADLATDYAVAYLETTRSMSELFSVVRSLDDVRVRPNLDEDEERVRAEFVDRYGAVIEPPTAVAQNDGYAATVYAVREQALERHDLTIDRDGVIADEPTPLMEDLPLVFGL